MDDIKLKLAEIEKQVSAIKDVEVRAAAFTTLLKHSLSDSSKEKSGKVARKVKSEKKKKKVSNPFYSEAMVRDVVMKINVTNSLEGFPSFKNCKSKKDVYLWVLVYAKRHKVMELNNHEIAYVLTKKLYRQTKYSTVYGIRTKVKEGLVMLDHESDSWIITPDGESYLKSLKMKSRNS